MKQKGPYIGIDVAKAHLDLAVHLSGDAWRVINDDPPSIHRYALIEPCLKSIGHT